MNANQTICLISAALVIIGLLMFLILMSSVKWDFSRITDVNYEKVTLDITDDFSDISINATSADITFHKSVDGSASITIYKKKSFTYSATVEEGKLILTENRDTLNPIKYIFSSRQKIDVYLPGEEYGALAVNVTTGDASIPSDFSFTSVMLDHTTGDISFSASVAGVLSIKSTTGDISVSGTSAGSISANVSTGDVNISSSSVGGQIVIKGTTSDVSLTNVSSESISANLTSGDITLTNSVASDMLDLVATTGDVTLNRCDGNTVKVKTTTGNICGTLLSKHVFTAEATTGSIKIPSYNTGGECNLKTTTGDIDVSVAED